MGRNTGSVVMLHGHFQYTLIRSSRKTIAIAITPDGHVQVRCPNRMPAAEVDAFVREKARWIKTHLDKYAALPHGEPFTKSEIECYVNRTKRLLQERLPTLAQQVGVSYRRISVRSQRTRWGSCSSRGNLNFNCLLSLVPTEVFDYVVIHELCHLKEMNHSPKFWSEVETHMPQYRNCKKWLKEQGSALIRRL